MSSAAMTSVRTSRSSTADPASRGAMTSAPAGVGSRVSRGTTQHATGAVPIVRSRVQPPFAAPVMSERLAISADTAPKTAWFLMLRGNVSGHNT